ncbi:MAG: hypothetical protein IJ608_03680 [Lachnospiraceae bacterium]|nr:hypothetical protein [Lachnospiraceae bacterium]
MIKVKDIFSMLRETELPVSTIEKWFLEDYEGKTIPEGYVFIREAIPENLDQNQSLLIKELLSEGKKVAFLKVDGRVVSMLGYCEENL